MGEKERGRKGGREGRRGGGRAYLNIAICQLGGKDEGGVGDTNAMVRLVPFFEAAEDRYGGRDSWLSHQDGLEAAFKGRVFLNVLPEGGREGVGRMSMGERTRRLGNEGGTEGRREPRMHGLRTSPTNPPSLPPPPPSFPPSLPPYRYSFNVVAPIHRNSPRANMGLSKFAASMAPSPRPAPSTRWISSKREEGKEGGREGGQG